MSRPTNPLATPPRRRARQQEAGDVTQPYRKDTIDELFGLCYLRVPTWAPFRLQVYFNGHQWLARQLG